MRGRRIRGAGSTLLFALAAVGLADAWPGGGAGRVQAAEPAIPPATKVALFTPPYPDPLVARIEAELAAVGIAVRKLETPPEAQLEAAITRELAAGAGAAIRVIPRSRGTEIWAGDTTTRVLRARSIRADTSDAALSVIALRTVEFLRATLLDVRRRAATVRPINGGVGAPTGKTAADQTGREPVAMERTAAPGWPNPVETPPSNAESADGRRSSSAGDRSVDRPGDRPVETIIVEAGGGPDASSRPPSSEGALARASQASRPDRLRGSEDATPEAEARAHALKAKAAGEVTRFDVSAGPALLGSPGGLSPVWAAAVVGRGRFTDTAGVELMAVFPLTAKRLDIPEVGQVETMPALFGAAATVRLSPSSGSPDAPEWVADAAAGVSAIMLRAKGSLGATGGSGTGSSASAAVVSAWKPAAHIRLGGGVRISPWLVFRLDLVGGLCTSRIGVGAVRTDAQGNQTSVDEGTFGPAFGTATLGLQASW